MRRVAPYLGIAVAVAIGVALAPYIGWVLVWLAAALAFCVAMAFLRRGVRRIRAALLAWRHRTLV
jgi:uncharacterized membrane protein YdjX (TVP38/TMEM64 family)